VVHTTSYAMVHSDKYADKREILRRAAKYFAGETNW
jgi:hypothetical protein